MKKRWLSIVMTLTIFMVAVSCSDESSDVTGPGDDAAGKGNNPKSQSIASDYNISLATDGYVFTYTITKNPGAKNLGHFIVNLDNCGDQSPHLASILSASVNADGHVTAVNLYDTEGWGTGCLPVSSNFIKFDNLPAATELQLSFILDSKYSNVAATGWVKAGTSCNTTSIQAPGCPVTGCVYGLGHFFSNGAAAWASDVTLGGFTYTQAEGNALWYGGNDSNTALKAFFRYAALYLSGVLGDAPQSAVQAIEDYFTNNGNKLTHTNINAGLFNNATIKTALDEINAWREANQCD